MAPIVLRATVGLGQSCAATSTENPSGSFDGRRIVFVLAHLLDLRSPVTQDAPRQACNKRQVLSAVLQTQFGLTDIHQDGSSVLKPHEQLDARQRTTLWASPHAQPRSMSFLRIRRASCGKCSRHVLKSAIEETQLSYRLLEALL